MSVVELELQLDYTRVFPTTTMKMFCCDLRQNAEQGLWAVVRRRPSQWGSHYISRTVWPKITQFYTDIHFDQPYIHTGYDITNYNSRQLLRKKTAKMLLPTTAGGISREGFKRGSRNFTGLSGTIGLTNLPDMTSLAISGWLQNAIKYCTKYVKRVCAAEESNNSATL